MHDQRSAGEVVTETFDYDGGRKVTVYIPADSPEAVVFAGDGQLISQWGGVLEAADVPSTMIVGVHGLADETPRRHEYSPAFDPEYQNAFGTITPLEWTTGMQPDDWRQSVNGR